MESEPEKRRFPVAILYLRQWVHSAKAGRASSLAYQVKQVVTIIQERFISTFRGSFPEATDASIILLD
jgi:hypothetical protein